MSLDTQTAVDITFDATQRLLHLRAGEILVTTHPDRLNRPLRVQTEQGVIRPVGTRFSVRQEANACRVSVFAGAVDVRPREAGSDLRVTAGQTVRFDRLGVSPATPLPAGAGDWAHGVLRVERMPLAAFVEELNRYRRGWLRCDPQVGPLLISGAFQLRDTDLVLSAVSQALPVQVVYRTRYWVTLQPRAV
ncbi:FecR domain-containing protein [Pseudomonas sp.]|uniref:FecR domain-containing protein n=1 Tax=Pseudomonas sp. TaxID=306 RepID=UPI00391AD2D5